MAATTSTDEQQQAWENARKALAQTQLSSPAKKEAAGNNNVINSNSMAYGNVTPQQSSQYYYHQYYGMPPNFMYSQMNPSSFHFASNYPAPYSTQSSPQQPPAPIPVPPQQASPSAAAFSYSYPPPPMVNGFSNNNQPPNLPQTRASFPTMNPPPVRNAFTSSPSANSFSYPSNNYTSFDQPINNNNKRAPGAMEIRFNLPKRHNNVMASNNSKVFGNGSLALSGSGNKGISEMSYPNSNQISLLPSKDVSVEESKSVPVSSTAKASQNLKEWPPELKLYVERAFAKCVLPVDKDQVEILLKGKISQAFMDGSVFTKDWSKEPLPNVHSDTLRREAESRKAAVMQDRAAAATQPVGGGDSTRGKGVRGFVQGRSKFLGRRTRTYSGSSSASSTASTSPRRKKRENSRSRSRSRSSGSNSSEGVSRGVPRISSSIVGPSPKNNSRAKKAAAALNKLGVASQIQEANNGKISKKKKKQQEALKKKVGNMFSLNEDVEKLQKRAARFQDENEEKVYKKSRLSFTGSLIKSGGEAGEEIDWSNLTIVGSCQDLEKPYLRLTAAPDPSTVRPLPVLKKALQHVKAAWLQQQDYHFACDQMKSIRQDLTVQCIRDSFSVHVYETHARIALEKGDHEEFNQCQTQLKALYAEIGGENKLEFLAYRILYSLFTANTLDLTSITQSLGVEEKSYECIDFALKLSRCWWLRNYHRFFQLYKEAPSMCGFLIDWFVERERKAAVKAMVKA